MYLLEQVVELTHHVGLPIDPNLPYLTTTRLNQTVTAESSTARLIRQLEQHFNISYPGQLPQLGARWRVIKMQADEFRPKKKTPFDGVKGEVLLYSGMYSPDLCVALPDLTFVFGDNTERVGLGGQACVRPCDNTFGVVTKRAPGNGLNDFFKDGVPKDMGELCEDLHNLEGLILNGHRIVLPVTREGRISLGCGLSNLPYSSPVAYMMIERWFERICDTHNAVTVK